MAAGVRLLPCVGPQVVEVLTHREDRECTGSMLAFEKLEKPSLCRRSQKIINFEVSTTGDVDIRRDKVLRLRRVNLVKLVQDQRVETGFLAILLIDKQFIIVLEPTFLQKLC